MIEEGREREEVREKRKRDRWRGDREEMRERDRLRVKSVD